jgi:hypothetical protein
VSAPPFALAILYQVTDGDLDVGGDTLKRNLNAPAFGVNLIAVVNSFQIIF